MLGPQAMNKDQLQTLASMVSPDVDSARPLPEDIKDDDYIVEHLDYKYITESTDVKYLCVLEAVLISGREGFWPDLLAHLRKRLAELDPSKAVPIELSGPERYKVKHEVDDELNRWSFEMNRSELNGGNKEASSSKLISQDSDSNQSLSDTEKLFMANQERFKGNESLKCGDDQEAYNFYQSSIKLYPTADTFNNLALLHLKRKEWLSCKAATLKSMELKTTFKALIRCASCQIEMSEFNEALEKIQMARAMSSEEKGARGDEELCSLESKALHGLKKNGGGVRLSIMEDEEEEVDYEVIDGVLVETAKSLKIESDEEGHEILVEDIAEALEDSDDD